MKLSVALLSSLVAVTMMSCAEKSSNKSTLPVEVNTALKFESERVLDVHYTTTAPVKRLAFSRSPDDQRLARWTPEADEFHITHEAGADYVSRKDGVGFTSVKFQVPMTFTILPADYAPFMPFSDGGVLLHSGRFQTCPESCVSDDLSNSYPMQLSSKSYGHIILQGERLETDASWSDRRDGTMVYVGNAAPIETDRVIAIIDPKLPDDIQAILNNLFPEMMDYFSENLGTLDDKPALFVALDRNTVPDGNPRSNSFSSKGGVLPGQVFIHLDGDGWLESLNVRGDYTKETLVRFFAHEAGHIYQRSSVYDSDEQDAWIHEGGADAFAIIALDTLGLIPETYIETRKVQSVEDCLAGLKQGDLRGAGARDDFKLYYSCGMVIQLAAHKVVQSKGNEKGIFVIWDDFLTAQTQDENWNENVFMRIVAEKTDPMTVDFIEKVIDGNPSLDQKTLLDAIR